MEFKPDLKTTDSFHPLDPLSKIEIEEASAFAIREELHLPSFLIRLHRVSDSVTDFLLHLFTPDHLLQELKQKSVIVSD